MLMEDGKESIMGEEKHQWRDNSGTFLDLHTESGLDYFYILIVRFWEADA